MSKNNNKLNFKKLGSSTLLHIILASIGVTMLLPFVWMLLTSVKPINEVGSESWLPTKSNWKFENYKEVFNTEPKQVVDGTVKSVEPGEQVVITTKVGDVAMTLDQKSSFINRGNLIPNDKLEVGMHVRGNRQAGGGIPFARFYWNSLFVSAWITLLQVITSAMAAFAFSRLKWPGRDKLFMLYLATMMLPGLVMMIPNYKIMMALGLVDTFLGLILPAAFSAFGCFMLRQFMLAIPTSLDEAAEIDGASKWQLFWDVILPLSRPGIVTLVIFTFMGAYRGFFWPLVMLKTVEKYTLPIGLLYFDSTRGQSTHLLMAAATMMIIPLIIIFLVMQKQLVKGIQLGAVKG